MSSIDSPAMKKHQLANLPDVVLRKIFELLDLDDLLNLAKIYGELKEVILEHMRSKLVTITQNKYYFSTAITRAYLVGKSLARLRMNNDLHLGIKKLTLVNPLALFNLTSFDNLIELRISSNTTFRRLNRIIFHLKNLEIFTTTINCQNVLIVLEAPKLRVLRSLSSSLLVNQFRLVHPQSVQEATCTKIDSIVKQMINLVSLRVHTFRIGEAGTLFEDLKQLREFFFKQTEDSSNATNVFLQSAVRAKPGLQAFYKNIDITSNPLLDPDTATISDFFLDDASLSILQRYSVDAVDVNELRIRHLAALPVELIRKMPLEILHVLGEIAEDEQWVELLKHPKLNIIRIDSVLRDDQLELIPEHCRITVNFLSVKSLVRGDWILRMKHLVVFESIVLFDFELFKMMIQQLYHLKSVMAQLCVVQIDDGGMVECRSNGVLVLREPKPVFLQTIELVSSWSLLFNFDHE